jgi:hypothetical protein
MVKQPAQKVFNSKYTGKNDIRTNTDLQKSCPYFLLGRIDILTFKKVYQIIEADGKMRYPIAA